MVNFNGDLLPETSHFANHTHRGLRYGDALSEPVRYTGREILFWEDHYFALMAGMRQLRMEIPMAFTPEYLQEQIGNTLKANGLDSKSAEVTLTVVRRGEPQTAGHTVDFLIETVLLETVPYTSGSGTCRADIYKDYLLPSGSLWALSHHNRLIEVLAGIYTRENGWDTCVMLNDRKEVVKTLEGVLFLRQGTALKTPGPSGGAPDCVLKKKLEGMVRKDGQYKWEAGAISPFDLQKADELFALHPVRGLQSITDYRKATFQTDAARHLTALLNQEAGLS